MPQQALGEGRPSTIANPPVPEGAQTRPGGHHRHLAPKSGAAGHRVGVKKIPVVNPYSKTGANQQHDPRRGKYGDTVHRSSAHTLTSTVPRVADPLGHFNPYCFRARVRVREMADTHHLTKSPFFPPSSAL